MKNYKHGTAPLTRKDQANDWDSPTLAQLVDSLQQQQREYAELQRKYDTAESRLTMAISRVKRAEQRADKLQQHLHHTLQPKPRKRNTPAAQQLPLTL